MRRNSPPRFIRRNSPPRRSGRPLGRPRSMSPQSRSQPPPPGEERSERNRKLNPWDAQNPHKRPRSRSRSRERMLRARESERDRLRGRIDREREPPVINIGNEEQSRGRFDRGRDLRREPLRDVLRKEERRGRSIEQHREREHNRTFHASKMSETLAKHKNNHKRHSLEHNREQTDGFEENYLDQHKNNFGNNDGFHNSHEGQILDPAAITFDAYPHPPEARLEIRQDKPREIRQLAVHPSAINLFGKHSAKHEKEENAEDRIHRLERLVEKLVEDNSKPTKSKESKRESNNSKPKDVIPELIPNNNKFTTSMWINRIHEECLHRNYDEKSSIRYMQDKMTGIMKAWFKSVSNYDFTWPELKLLVTKTFPDNVEFVQTLKLLVSRDKTIDETITQYYFSKVYLCEACKITGENAVSCLIDGLSNPFMKQDIKSCNFLTPEALYSEYLSKFPERDVPVKADHREVRVEHREEAEYHNEDFIPFETRMEIEERDREFRMQPGSSAFRGERFVNRLADPPMERPSERQKCFTCKKFGHIAVDCRHAPICYNCKKKGHIAAKCHLNNVMYIVSVGSKQLKAPVVTCKANGKEFDGIIDTGATPVTMTKNLSTYLQLNLDKTNEVLKGFGGSVVSALGEVEVTMMVNSVQRLVRVLVVDDTVQDDQLIIGQEFLSKNLSVFIQNGKVHITNTGSDALEK